MTKVAELEELFNQHCARAEAQQQATNQRFEDVLKAISELATKVEQLQPVAKVSHGDDGFLYTAQQPETSVAGEKKKVVEEAIFQESDKGEFGSGSGVFRENFRVNGAEYRLKKLKMPIFEGDDAYGWIYRMERFFNVQGIEVVNQLRAAELCLEGEALSWYRWSEGRAPFQSWESLKKRLLDRFQQSQEGSLYEQFLAISQVGSAREYVALFEKLAGQLIDVPEPVLEGTFIKGLKPELSSTVRVMQPKSVSQAMKLSIMIDENRTVGINSQSKSSNWLAESLTGPTSTGEHFRRLTESELLDRKANGLCFRCDEKFTPGHRCAIPSLKVLLVDEGEGEDRMDLHVKAWDAGLKAD